MLRTKRLAACFAPLLLAPAALSQTVRFDLIPNVAGANDLSPDGRFLVGDADFDGDGIADGTYRLDRVTGEMTDLHNVLDPSTGVPVVAVSDDGRVVFGSIPDPNDPDPSMGHVAGIWRESTGQWESIGYLPNALECPSRASGYEISGDGSVAVGLSWNGCSGRAFRWTAASGMQELQVLGGGGNRASVISSDGAIIGGFGRGTVYDRTPAVWYTDGTGEALDPNGEALGEIHGISDDGTVLLGEWLTSEPVTRASKWTGGRGAWTRQQIAGGSLLPAWSGKALDIADNGTIVGFDFFVGNRVAWIQPNGAGPLVNLRAYIESHGGTVPATVPLQVCQAISRDGRFIIGHGFGTGAWIVTILPDCPSDVNGDGVCDLSDLTVLLSAFGTCAGGAGFNSAADVNADLCVTLSDLTLLLSAFGSACE